MSVEQRFTLWVREKAEVNTDPQRRCYYGVHARSEMQWTAWGIVYQSKDKLALEDSARVFKKINHTHEYKVLPIGEQPWRF